MDSRVTIPLRSRGWSHQRGRRPQNTSASTVVGNSSFFTSGPPEKAGVRSRSVPARRVLGRTDISAPMAPAKKEEKRMPREYELSQRSEPDHAIHRLLLLAYLPSGFWSRLLTRILGDDTVVEIIRSYFLIPQVRISTLVGNRNVILISSIETKPNNSCLESLLKCIHAISKAEFQF